MRSFDRGSEEGETNVIVRLISRDLKGRTTIYYAYNISSRLFFKNKIIGRSTLGNDKVERLANSRLSSRPSRGRVVVVARCCLNKIPEWHRVSGLLFFFVFFFFFKHLPFIFHFCTWHRWYNRTGYWRILTNFRLEFSSDFLNTDSDPINILRWK